MSSDISLEIDSRLVNVRLSDGKHTASKACSRRPVKSSLKLGASKLNPNSFLEPKEEPFVPGVNRSAISSLGNTVKDKGLMPHSADKSMKRLNQTSAINKESDTFAYLSQNFSKYEQVNFFDCVDSTEYGTRHDLDKQKEDFLKLLDLQKCNQLLEDKKRNDNYSSLEEKLLKDCLSNRTQSLKPHSTSNGKVNHISVPLFAHSTKNEVKKSNIDTLKDKEDFLKKLDLQMVSTVIGGQRSAEPEIRISAQERFGSAKSISWKDLEQEKDDKTVNLRPGLEKFSTAKSISWQDLEQRSDESPLERRYGMSTSMRYGVVRVADKLGRLAGEIVDRMQDSYVDYIE